MGLIIGIIKCLVKLLFYLAIFVAIIVLIPSLPPYTKFTSIQLEQTQQRIGALAPNNLLNNAEKVYEDKLVGPEAFQVYNGELYTSLATGEIVKVSPGGHVTFVTKIGQPCTGLTQEHKCGRPLGFVIDEKSNTLYIADAYHGIWKVDLKTDKKQLLVSPQVPIEGRKPKLFNSIALSKNGDLYWTDSTSDFHLKDGAMTALTDPSGRLLHYVAAKNQSKVLLDNLWFPNGLVLSQDNQFLVIAETYHLRLLKYFIDGSKKGKSEVFAAGLPGTPDNVRVLPDNSGVLVGLYTVFDDEQPLLSRTMSETPLARKFLARLQRLIEIPFEYLNSIYPHIILEEIVYYIGHFQSVSGLLPRLSGLLQLDWNGNIVASYYNTDKSLDHISDAIVYNGKLYIGNPHVQNFIGSVPVPPLLLKAFNSKKVEQKIPKVVQKLKEIKVEQKVVKPVESQTKPPPQKPAISKTETVPETKPTIKPETTPTPKIETKVTPKPDVKPTPKVETKPTIKPDTIPTPKVETKPTPKVEIKPTPKPDTKPTPKVETKTNPKVETKPTPKVETKPIPKVETKTTPKPETKSTVKVETKPTPKSDIKPTPKVETKQPTPKAEAKPILKEETKPTQKPEHSKPSVNKQESKDSLKKKNADQKPASNQIPIKEDIISDTKKPNSETLKVIKKGGPAEIPNPEK